MKKLYGVTTAPTTPFKADGSVDLEAVKRNTEFLVGKGIHCIYPLGTTGEMLHLSLEERKQIAETVMETVAGRITVFIHCGADTTAQVVELAQHARSIGADGIGAVTPYYIGVNDREMEEFYVTVAQSVPELPVYMYSIPQCAANDIAPAVVVAARKRCPNIVGIKYSYADVNRIIDFCKIEGLSVLLGPDFMMLQGLTMGCEGAVSGISGVFPEPFVAAYNAYVAGDWKEAEKQQKIAVDYVRMLRGGSNMAFFKTALDYRGQTGGHMRAPQLDLTTEEREAFLKELKAMDVYG